MINIKQLEIFEVFIQVFLIFKFYFFNQWNLNLIILVRLNSIIGSFVYNRIKTRIHIPNRVRCEKYNDKNEKSCPNTQVESYYL